MKMLVCTDGSRYSQQAIKEAVKIAANLKRVAVYIIFVCETAKPSAFDYDGGSMRYEELKRKGEGEKVLQEAVRAFEEKRIKPVAIIRKGHPSREIVKMTAEANIDLVIVGSRGLSGIKKVILGSVSNAVAQESNCNVLIVKQGDKRRSSNLEKEKHPDYSPLT